MMIKKYLIAVLQDLGRHILFFSIIFLMAHLMVQQSSLSPVNALQYEMMVKGCMVEAAGVEPASRNVPLKASTGIFRIYFLIPR